MSCLLPPSPRHFSNAALRSDNNVHQQHTNTASLNARSQAFNKTPIIIRPTGALSKPYAQSCLQTSAKHYYNIMSFTSCHITLTIRILPPHACKRASLGPQQAHFPMIYPRTSDSEMSDSTSYTYASGIFPDSRLPLAIAEDVPSSRTIRALCSDTPRDPGFGSLLPRGV